MLPSAPPPPPPSSSPPRPPLSSPGFSDAAPGPVRRRLDAHLLLLSSLPQAAPAPSQLPAASEGMLEKLELEDEGKKNRIIKLNLKNGGRGGKGAAPRLLSRPLPPEGLPQRPRARLAASGPPLRGCKAEGRRPRPLSEPFFFL